VPVIEPVGLLAEFADADALVAASGRVRAAGYTRLEAFAPYPLPEAAAALGYGYSAIPGIVFLGGLIGGSAGFFMQYWVAVIDYPLNIGGRPLNSWPSFIPITFELTVLTASLCAFLGLMVLCGLPRYHHPLFGVPAFARAASDRFFIYIEANDPCFNLPATRDLLASLSPMSVEEVRA
jgi:hypothetical protein